MKIIRRVSNEQIRATNTDLTEIDGLQIALQPDQQSVVMLSLTIPALVTNRQEQQATSFAITVDDSPVMVGWVTPPHGGQILSVHIEHDMLMQPNHDYIIQGKWSVSYEGDYAGLQAPAVLKVIILPEDTIFDNQE